MTKNPANCFFYHFFPHILSFQSICILSKNKQSDQSNITNKVMTRTTTLPDHFSQEVSNPNHMESYLESNNSNLCNSFNLEY